MESRSSLWSAYTDEYVKKDYKWIKSAFIRTCTYSGVIALGTILVAFFVDDIIFLWMHIKLEYSILLVVFSVCYQIFNLYAGTCCILLNGIGEIDVQLYAWMISAAIIIPLSYFFINIIGMQVEGVMFAQTCSILILILVLPKYVSRLFKLWDSCIK